MLKSPLFKLLVFILFGCCSCVFSLEKENFVEVNQNVESPEIYNLNNSLDDDTIYFWYAQQFTFDLSSSDQSIIGVKVYVNDKTFTFDGGSGSFTLYLSDFPDINFSQLKIEIYTESGTGSLADKLHREGFTFEKTWVLAINQVKGYNPNFRYSITENGFLKLEWDRYLWDNFYSYNIGASYSSFVIDPMPAHYIKNVEQNYFIDSSYVGGPIEYVFTNYLSANSNFHLSDSAILKINIPVPEISFSSTPDSLTIRWTKSKLDGIYELNDSRYQFDYIHFTSDNDTSFTMANPGIGPDITFNLYISSKNWVVGFLKTKVTVSKNWGIGQQNSLIFDRFFFNPKLNFIYDTYGYNLSIYNATNLKQPWFNKFLQDYVRAIDFVDDSSKIAISTDRISFYDIRTMNIIQEFPLNFYNESGFIKVVTDSLALFNSGTALITYNYRNSQIVSSTPFTAYYFSTPNGVSVSHGLKWFVYASDNGLCLMENTGDFQYEKRLESMDKYHGAIFDPINENYLWIGKEDKLQLFDLQKMKIIQEFNDVKGYLMNIDPFSSRLLLQSKTEKKIYLFNLTTRQVDYSANYSNGWENSFYLLQNILYENCGYQYDLTPYLH
jgi:hypothetical protein